MKKIIRKILTEKFDLDWIQNQNPESWEEFMFPYINLNGWVIHLGGDDIIVYYNKDDEWVFYHEQNPKNNYVWFNYNKIWSKLKTEFGYDYNEIQKLMKIWLEQHYNLREVTPTYAGRI